MEKLKTKIKKLLGNRHNNSLRIVRMEDFEGLLKIFQEEKSHLCVFRGEPSLYSELESSWLKASLENRNDIMGMFTDERPLLRKKVDVFNDYLQVIKKNDKYAQMTTLAILASMYTHKDVVTPLIGFTSNILLAFWKALTSGQSNNDAALYVFIAKQSEIKHDIDFEDKKLIENSIFESPYQSDQLIGAKTYFVVDCQNWHFAKNTLRIAINKRLIGEILNHLQKHRITYQALFPGLKGAYQSIVMSPATNHLLDGYLHTKSYRYQDAIRSFTKAILLDPTSAIAYSGRANSWHFLRNNTKELSDLSKAVELDPSNWKYHFNKAELLTLLNKHEEAIVHYDKTIALHSGHKESQIRMGIAYSYLGDLKKAMACFNHVLAIDNANVMARFYRGKILLLHYHDHEQAIADFTSVIENSRYSHLDIRVIFDYQWQAYFMRGSVRAEHKQYKQALADLNQALEMEGRNSEIHYTKGLVLEALNKHEVAIASFSRAIAIEPKSAEALAKRGSTYLGFGKYKEAIRDFTRVLKLDSEAIEAYIARGDAYLFSDKAKEALRDYNKVLKLAPDSTEAYYKKGQALISLGKADEALKNLDQAISLNPKYWRAYLGKAQAYMIAKRYKDALEAFNELIQLKPDNPHYYKFRGELLVNTGEKEAGLKDIAKAKKLGLDEPDGILH